MPELKSGNGIHLELDAELEELTASAVNREIVRPTFIDHTAAAEHYTGTATGGTATTLEDSSASWTTNEWTDKIVRIDRNGSNDYEYGVVESNTSNTLVFDDDLIFAPCDQCAYQIIDTVVIDPEDMPLKIALNVESYQCGVLLPESTEDIERLEIHAYIERSNGSENNVPIMCRGTERQLGAKYGELQYTGEAVTLDAHQWVVPHWDVVSTENIKRIAAGYWETDEDIPQTEFGPIGSDGVVIYDQLKRFIPYVRDGKRWLRYRSLFERTFKATFTAHINKTGGVGEMFITIAKRHADTGQIEYLDTRLSQTRFGAGEGRTTITVEVPVTLRRNDEVIAAGYRSAQTFSVENGSTLTLVEF